MGVKSAFNNVSRPVLSSRLVELGIELMDRLLDEQPQG